LGNRGLRSWRLFLAGNGLLLARDCGSKTAMTSRRKMLTQSAQMAAALALSPSLTPLLAATEGSPNKGKDAKRINFAICNETFQKWEYKDIVDCVAKTGYDGVELAPFTFADSVNDLSAKQRKEMRKQTEGAGLKITGLHWLLVKPEGLHINHPDPNIRQTTRAYLGDLIDFCADVGGKVMVFGSPKQRQVLPGISREDAWKHTVEAFASLGPKARERGVMICLEALPTSLTNLLNTNAEVRKMVGEINHPSIQMMVDVKSMCAETISIPENIRQCKGLFYHFHANDSNMRGPGFGDVDFKPIFAALQEVKFSGYASVEIFDYSIDPRTTATKSLAYMKRCLG
jgi:sugar phosphate isomerase/epimerase